MQGTTNEAFAPAHAFHPHPCRRSVWRLSMRRNALSLLSSYISNGSACIKCWT